MTDDDKPTLDMMNFEEFVEQMIVEDEYKGDNIFSAMLRDGLVCDSCENKMMENENNGTFFCPVCEE